MKSRKWIVVLVLVVIAVAATLWLLRSRNASANISENDLITAQQVPTYPVIVEATGTLEALRSVNVGPPQLRRERRFKLAKIVEEGKRVTEGDFLMEFDTSDIQERLKDEIGNFQRVQENRQKGRSNADIQLKNQRLSLEQAKTELEKLEMKMNSQVELLSGIEVEQLRIQLDAARRNVEFLEKKLDYQTKSDQLDLQILRSNERHYRDRIDDLMDAIDSYTVRAPADGVVIYYRDQGDSEAKEIGDDVFFMETVIEMPDLTSLRARVQIDEFDSGKIKVGQDATVFVDAVRGQTYGGTVVSVGTILKQISPDRPQKVCDAYIQIDSGDLKQLRPGMSMKAQVMVDKYSDVVVIPLSSIHEKDGRSFVQVLNPKTKSFDWREIRLRANDEMRAVVESGLEPDEQIRVKPKV